MLHEQVIPVVTAKQYTLKINYVKNSSVFKFFNAKYHQFSNVLKRSLKHKILAQ